MEEHINQIEHDVVIIGSGLAGLAAAKKLLQLGIPDFVILEARNRIGGRVFTLHSGDCPIELGANWIHGTQGNPLFQLANLKQMVNSKSTNTTHRVVALGETGERIKFRILQEVYEAYYWFFKRCEEYYAQKYLPPTNILSVGAHMEMEINIYLERFDDQERKIRRQLFDYLLKRECCITGCNSMNSVDLVGIGSYEELAGGNVTLTRGFASLLEEIAQGIPEEVFLCKHAVKTIHWKKSSSAIEEKYKYNVVECENGAVFHAKYVLCTIPLGVLKKDHLSLFCPSLPQEKLQSFQNLNFGTVNKIFLEWTEPFLSPNISEIILLWNESELSEVCAKKQWYKKLYSFCKLSENILVTWIAGEEAVHLEALSLQEVAETCWTILKTFLKDPTLARPKSCIFTTWNKQEYTRGSYTSIGVGGSSKDIKIISQPLPFPDGEKSVCKTEIYFAGEHCHVKYYSTGHGAFLSGISAGSEIAHKLNGKMKQKEFSNNLRAEMSDLFNDVVYEGTSSARRDNCKFPTPR